MTNSKAVPHCDCPEAKKRSTRAAHGIHLHETVSDDGWTCKYCEHFAVFLKPTETTILKTDRNTPRGTVTIADYHRADGARTPRKKVIQQRGEITAKSDKETLVFKSLTQARDILCISVEKILQSIRTQTAYKGYMFTRSVK